MSGKLIFVSLTTPKKGIFLKKKGAGFSYYYQVTYCVFRFCISADQRKLSISLSVSQFYFSVAFPKVCAFEIHSN